MNPFALLDSAHENRARLYTQSIRNDSLLAAQLDELDGILKQGWALNWHACLTIPYDFGLDLMAITQTNSPMSIDWYQKLTFLEDTDEWLAQQLDENTPAGVIAPELALDGAAFAKRIAQIHEYIRAGQTYQVNFTTHCDFSVYGHPIALYRQLRRVQPAPYAALIYHGGQHWTLSLSPERFFSIDGRHVISEPMKGTAPICDDEGDAQRASALALDVKNRAENAMIVDLLRNDLGKISVLGSVCVHEPFKVKPFGSVWQMTTEVHAKLEPSTTYASLLRAVFPCGSITGAPKYRTMQIIAQLEEAPRGLYTGSIGYLDANGTGCFNVAIRTLTIEGNRGRLGVGGGITIDSTAEGEYAECHWKKAFLQHPTLPFTLFETIAVNAGQAPLLAQHLQRLEHSARALGFSCDRSAIEQALLVHIDNKCKGQGQQRLKISLAQDGSYELTSAPCITLGAMQTAVIHDETLPNTDALRRYKTSQRCVYDRAWQQASSQGAFDGLVFNHNGELLEGGRSSAFVYIDGQWHTPALDLDILPGIMRQRVMDDPQRYLNTTQIIESRISRADMARADAIVLTNALRGLVPVRLVGV